MFELDASRIAPVVTRGFRRLIGSQENLSLTTATDYVFLLAILECPLLLKYVASQHLVNSADISDRPQDHLPILEGAVGMLASLVHRDPTEQILKPLFEIYTAHNPTYCQRSVQASTV